LLVWLASYPRSGNHLLRTILQRCFDLGSYEIYQPIARPLGAECAAVIGERRFDDESKDDFLARARSSPELFLVKTHSPIPKSDRCIYIVRDGRAALVSYRRYLAEVENKTASLPELIAGERWPGSWHDHVGRFLRRAPKKTLVLCYEALSSENPPLDKIGAFLGVSPLRPFDVAFRSLHEIDPRIFPIGHNRVGIDTVERDHRDLFWKHCGPMMRTLGYASGGRGTVSPVLSGAFHDFLSRLRVRVPARRSTR
jgi:Sulfotransferase domain